MKDDKLGELDEFDRRIVAALIEDGRMTVTDLAGSVGLSKTPCQVRLRRLVEPAVRRFDPDLILVACGFDASARDPAGRMMLSAPAFARMTQLMLDLAGECCDGRLALIQEGGYSAMYVPFCGVYTVAALLGVDSGGRDAAPGIDTLAGQHLLPHQRSAVEAAVAAAVGAGAVSA